MGTDGNFNRLIFQNFDPFEVKKRTKNLQMQKNRRTKTKLGIKTKATEKKFCAKMIRDLILKLNIEIFRQSKKKSKKGIKKSKMNKSE